MRALLHWQLLDVPWGRRVSYSGRTEIDLTCASCTAVATKIVKIGTKPYWVCDVHYEEHQRPLR